MDTHLHKPFGLPPDQREGVTPAALIIGVLASAALVAITPYNNSLLMNTWIAGNHFPIGAFTVLVVLTLVVNAALRKSLPRLVLSPAQLIAVWAIVMVPSGIPSSGMMRYLVPGIVSYRYYASMENKWEELIGEHIAPSLAVLDKTAAKTFFEGLPSGGSIPWQAWLMPLLTWGIYVAAMYAMMIGVSVMLRRRWVEQERFTFPLVQLPIAVASAPAGGRLINEFLSNPLLWLGATITIVIHSVGGLHQLYPALPDIPMSTEVYLTERPWSWAPAMGFYIYPLMIGFFYLLPSEVSFSLWFFYLFIRVQAIIIGLLGFPIMGGSPSWCSPLWLAAEVAGATIGLAGWFVWVARDHFRNIFRKAFIGDPTVEDGDEPLSYRFAAGLFLVGTVIMIVWLVYFGGNLVLGVVNVLGALAVYITLAWMVAQGGLVFVETGFFTTHITTVLTGSKLWPPRSIVINIWNENIVRVNLREYLLPSLLNAHKVSDAPGLHRGSLLKACLVSLAVAFLVALAAAIWLPYVHGPAVSFPVDGTYWAPGFFTWASSLTITPTNPSPLHVVHFVFGILLVMAISWMRGQFSWFSLHPIGFVVAQRSWVHTAVWLNAFLAWAVKGALTRWGGYKVYRRLRPFFFGLIMGDCLAGAIWIIVGFITGEGFNILPG